MDEHEGGRIIIEDPGLRSGFVQVPQAVFFDAGLTDGAVRVYGALLWWAWKTGKAPEQKFMGQELGMGESTVRRHLAALKDAGYIRVEQLGLGRANEYIILALKDANPDRSKLSGLGAQNRAVKPLKNERSSRTTSDSTTQTLSHSTDLADAFFSAIGEKKPAKKRRERALAIIEDLTAEGFTADAIRAACKLAGERGARGPDLLPYLIGEAHSLLEAQTTTKAKQAQITATTEKEQQEAAERHSEGLALVEALTPEERARLEAQARATLGLDPDRHKGPASQAVITGWIMTRLRGEAHERLESGS